MNDFYLFRFHKKALCFCSLLFQAVFLLIACTCNLTGQFVTIARLIMATTQDLLNTWLPGGVSSVHVICLKQSDFDSLHTLIRHEFPGVAMFQAVNCGGKLSTFADFAALEFPVAKRTQNAVLQKEAQSHARDIVTPGPIGCAQSHMTIWKRNQHAPGWIVVFESDVRAKSTIRDFIRTATAQPFPTVNTPGIVKLGWILSHGSVESVSANMWKVTGKRNFGFQAYAIRASDVATYLKALNPISGHIDLQTVEAAVYGQAPPIWQTTKNVCYQYVIKNKKSMHGTPALRPMLPDNCHQSNAIIIVPWVIVLASLVTIGVLAFYVNKYKK
jgi:hypothetical protein